MLEIRERVDHGEPSLTLTLPFDERQRSRALVSLSSGEQAALLLARGTVLRGGDRLLLSDGRIALVRAADETVSSVYSDDAPALMRAAYHLGNRHVPVQLGDGFVRYAHDHVLDGMVRELGLMVTVEATGFEPEAGAFRHGGHRHHAESTHDHPHTDSHDHGHRHGHSHSHAHGHAHAHGNGEKA